MIAAMYKLMPKSLEETMLLKGDDDSFEELFDRLVAFAATKNSLRLAANTSKSNEHDPDAMEVDALWKGGKGKGQNKGNTQDKSTSQYWVCDGVGHYGRDCWYTDKDKGKSKGKGGDKGKGGGDKGKGKGKSKSYGGKSKGKYKGKKLNAVDGETEEHMRECHGEPGGSQGWTASEWATASWEQQPWEPDDGAGLGGVGLGGFGDRENPRYVVEYKGERWYRLNCDSGAAVTALSVAMGEGLPLHEQGEFRVASGMAIRNLGKVSLQTEDEYGIRRQLRGNVTEVSKPLLSAGQISKNYDAHIFEDGGVLIRRDSSMAKKVRNFMKKMNDKYGTKGQIKLYKEANVYNAYLKTSKATIDDQDVKHLAPVGEDDADKMDMDMEGPSSGNGGQAQA